LRHTQPPPPPPAFPSLHPPAGCISASKQRLYTVALLAVAFPTTVIFAAVLPMWMLSLQLAVVLAADDVDDLMHALDPWKVRPN
jgi:hypothetical protein